MVGGGRGSGALRVVAGRDLRPPRPGLAAPRFADSGCIQGPQTGGHGKSRRYGLGQYRLGNLSLPWNKMVWKDARRRVYEAEAGEGEGISPGGIPSLPVMQVLGRMVQT